MLASQTAADVPESVDSLRKKMAGIVSRQGFSQLAGGWQKNGTIDCHSNHQPLD
jgi:hypothetical protein